jgi:DNA-binding transcriptional ArsR family regulator
VLDLPVPWMNNPGMESTELELASKRAKVFKAMAHPSRMHIINLLRDGPRNVGELTATIGSDISTVSKHLGILKESGIVSAEQRGKSVYYELYCSCIPEFVRCVDEVIAHNICPARLPRPEISGVEAAANS